MSRFAPVLRFEDARECYDVGGFSPREALEASLESSPVSFAAYLNDEPVCIWGVGRSSAIGVGHPWLLGSKLVEEIPVSFLRQSLLWLREMEKNYAVLTNITDERNTVHVKWLAWLGFKLTHRYPNVGPGHVSVIQFSKVSSQCVNPSPPL